VALLNALLESGGCDEFVPRLAARDCRLRRNSTFVSETKSASVELPLVAKAAVGDVLR
jgi:hypothetical protein